MRYLLAILALSGVFLGLFTALWGWPGMAGLAVVFPATLWAVSVVHVLEASAGRVELRMGFVAMGFALGIGAALASFVVLSAARAPEVVHLERVERVPVAVQEVWVAVEEPTYWMRWDALVGEIEPAERAEGSASTPIYPALLNLAGVTVPVHLTPTERVPGRVLRWRATWKAGSPVEDFIFGVELEPKQGETTIHYRVDYRLPTLGARVANRLALEKGLAEAASLSLAGLRDWLQSQQ